MLQRPRFSLQRLGSTLTLPNACTATTLVLTATVRVCPYFTECTRYNGCYLPSPILAYMLQRLISLLQWLSKVCPPKNSQTYIFFIFIFLYFYFIFYTHFFFSWGQSRYNVKIMCCSEGPQLLAVYQLHCSRLLPRCSEKPLPSVAVSVSLQ